MHERPYLPGIVRRRWRSVYRLKPSAFAQWQIHPARLKCGLFFAGFYNKAAAAKAAPSGVARDAGKAGAKNIACKPESVF
jgi:hypothetical protein